MGERLVNKLANAFFAYINADYSEYRIMRKEFTKALHKLNVYVNEKEDEQYTELVDVMYEFLYNEPLYVTDVIDRLSEFI